MRTVRRSVAAALLFVSLVLLVWLAPPPSRHVDIGSAAEAAGFGKKKATQGMATAKDKVNIRAALKKLNLVRNNLTRTKVVHGGLRDSALHHIDGARKDLQRLDGIIRARK
jgi:hypothetical protein